MAYTSHGNLGKRLAPRCALAGIEIALVGTRGKVVDVHHAGSKKSWGWDKLC